MHSPQIQRDTDSTSWLPHGQAYSVMALFFQQLLGLGIPQAMAHFDDFV